MVKQNIRNAFDAIHCDGELKERTRAAVVGKMRRRQQKKTHRKHRFTSPGIKWVITAACLMLLVGSGFGGYRLYYTEAATISIDVNPSIELDINRFGRVVDEVPYGTDGETVLREVSLKHLEYGEAMERLLGSEAMRSYLQDNAVVSVTLENRNGNGQLLEDLQDYVDTALEQCHGNVTAEYASVDGHMCSEAHSHGMSVGKYYAIQELLDVDPRATLEEFRDKSMKEIKGHTEHCEHRMEQNEERRDGQLKPDSGSFDSGAASDSGSSDSGAASDSGSSEEGCSPDSRGKNHNKHHSGHN